MKNKNAGLSLVEFIVVIAILAVLTGISVYGISQTSGYAARECSNAISSALSSCKVTTLGKAKSTGDIYWEIYTEDDKYYFRTVYNANTGDEYEVIEEVGKSIYGVTYGTGLSYNNGDYLVTGGRGAGLKLCFNRSSGALCELDGTVTDIQNITVISRGTKIFSIEMHPTTGKIKGTL